MVLITAFTEDDVEAAYIIFKKQRLSPWSLSTFKASAMNGLSLLAKENDRPIAYILLASVLDEFTIEDIAVERDYRSQGIGRKLMVAGLALAERMQQKTCYLEVRESNLLAIQFYTAVGFVLVGERKNYYERVLDSEIDSELVSPSSQAPGKAVSRENAHIMKKVL